MVIKCKISLKSSLQQQRWNFRDVTEKKSLSFSKKLRLKYRVFIKTEVYRVLFIGFIAKKSLEQNISWCFWPHHQSCSWIHLEFWVFQHPTPSPLQPTGGRSDQMATTSYLAPRVVPSPAKAMWSLSLGGPADSYPPLLLPQLSVLRALTSKWAANFQHPTSMGRHLPFHPASLR